LIAEIDRLNVIVASQPVQATFLALPERYRNLRLSLVELRARLDDSWSDDQRRVVQDAIAKLTDTENSVVRYIGDETRALPKIAPLGVSIQVISTLLTTLSVELNKRAVGE